MADYFCVVFLMLFAMFTAGFTSATLTLFVFCANVVLGDEAYLVTRRSDADNGAGAPHSLNVSTCPGYTLQNLDKTRNGLTASLVLAGPACNAFGNDVANLTLEVSYETESRLHVHISDTSDLQFRIPESVFSRPSSKAGLDQKESELEFHYSTAPFEFWITRRSEGKDSVPLFDTRKSSLPATPIPPLNASDVRTALDGFPLVFEGQYLQLTSALPYNANIYGLGEVISSSGFRRDVGVGNATKNGLGTIQTMWNRDSGSSIDGNTYGSHPIYLEHRYNKTSGSAKSHGAFLLNSAGMDILLATPSSSNTSLVQYRAIGGALDLYFLSGPTSNQVIKQYGEIVGFPMWEPYWAFGFHLSRWGYSNISITREQVVRMREANIPLEVMWNDIDLYHAFRDFTTDPVSFPTEDVRNFTRELASNNQHYIPIVDAAIPKTANSTDVYHPYTNGASRNVFVLNPDGSEYVGQVWPGSTVFPDWFASNTSGWWTEAIHNWSTTGGVEFSGTWIDMNEPSSFCEGSCGSNVSITDAGSIVKRSLAEHHIMKRGPGAGSQSGVDLNTPPYAIHNAYLRLSSNTVAINATTAAGYVHLDVHNLYGLQMSRDTFLAVQRLRPGVRPFVIGRSTFPSAGEMVEPLDYDTTEELCNRWLQLAAFTPFFRNHNMLGALSQEPYRWESVAKASRSAIAIRYSLLPYWYTLFANASTRGSPPIHALFWEFPNEPELYAVDKQFLIGRDILIIPVLEPNVSTVDGIFPGRGSVVWRDWYTHEVVNASSSSSDAGPYTTTLEAPLGHINIHIRDGAILLLHAQPAYTIAETRAGPFALLITLPLPVQRADQNRGGEKDESELSAFGTAYIDDGESLPPGPSKTIKFYASVGTSGGRLTSRASGTYKVDQKLTQATILGVPASPSAVRLQGKKVNNKSWAYEDGKGKLVVTGDGVEVDLNRNIDLEWE